MIVIPMAGMSSRFFRAGYTKPKYMLEAHGETLFDHSVKSFQSYFTKIPFLFIVRDIYETKAFVQERVKKLGIKEYYISTLDRETRGQAETVALGLDLLESELSSYQGPLTIFNIDTFRPGFNFPDIARKSDGYLEVFEGTGDNWSFAQPVQEGSTRVLRTAEKKPISNLCSTGLYHFNRKLDYVNSYLSYLAKPKEEWENGELYIAPLYNELIESGLNIHYHLIKRSEVIFCGVPEEYTTFINMDVSDKQ